MTTFDETLHPRATDGTFAEKPQSAPEASLGEVTPYQMGLMGLGPASKNDFAEPFDTALDRRPLRPYLPLTPGDDDEVFDAPTGTVLTCSDKGAVSRFEKVFDGSWVTLGERGAPHKRVTAGDVWGALFREDGTMRSAKLDLPLGTLYSDKTWFTSQEETDSPLTPADVEGRLHGSVVRMVSHADFGDERVSGVPEGERGALTFDSRDGYVQIVSRGRRPSKRTVNLSQVECFDRAGDVVLRWEHSPGYGYEIVLRKDRPEEV